jgi:hypothetical protein
MAPSEVLQKLPERFPIASLKSAFLPSIVDKPLDESFIEPRDGFGARQNRPAFAF